MKPGDVDIARTETWTRWRRSLCDHCDALCCHLPVEVRNSDLLRMKLIDEFDMAEEPKLLARRLLKSGKIAHFNHKSSLFTLVQHSSGACEYLDLATRRCTIYEQRPDTCRRHPQQGPRPGFCAYRVRA